MKENILWLRAEMLARYNQALGGLQRKIADLIQYSSEKRKQTLNIHP